LVRRLAGVGGRMPPPPTPLDFVAAIQEAALQKKVARFTRAYESARFGQSADDAQSLPQLFRDITGRDGAKSEETPDRAAAS
jgi:hypothetical protein